MDPTNGLAPQPGQLRVLHVEDNQLDAELVAQALRKGGFSVSMVVVQAEAEFERQLPLHRPDVVIADYNLPKGLNGLEIIARLQKQLQHAIPAIILTGDISTDSLREIAAHGCVHLNKPVRAKELTGLAQRLLAKPSLAEPESGQQLPLSLAGAEEASTVFVVDDDRSIRELLSMHLEERGFGVVSAATGAEGFRMAEEVNPSAIVLDMRLPDGSGLDLIPELKKRAAEAPVLMITAHHDMATTILAMKAGAFDYIHKPIDIQALRHFRANAQWDNWIKDLTTEQYQLIYEEPVYPKNIYLDHAPYGHDEYRREVTARQIELMHERDIWVRPDDPRHSADPGER